MKYINILIINPDKSYINKIKKFLNNKNIKIFQAQNMREALLLVIKNSIEIIIYDFYMPHFKNCEIIKILQKNSMNKNISFTFISNSSEMIDLHTKISEKIAL